MSNQRSAALSRWFFCEGRGYTGKIFETEVLGQCVSRKYPREVHFINDFEAMAIARASQPKSPCIIAKKFLFLVVQALEVCEGEVAFFTAVGSPLDRFYGVDCWFEWHGHIVTVDVTLNRAKTCGYKANIIAPMEHGDSDLTEVAFQVASALDSLERCEVIGRERCITLSEKFKASNAPKVAVNTKISAPKSPRPVEMAWLRTPTAVLA